MNRSFPTHAVVVALKEHVFADLGNDAVILHLQSGTYYGLNAVGARVWELIQRPKTVEEIQRSILEEYDLGSKDCEQELIRFLKQLSDAGLVEVRDGTRN